jgi:bifunctional non-homologous end joining protein LigD
VTAEQQSSTNFAFDLLYLNGQSLTEVGLEQRKQALASLLAKQKEISHSRYSDHVVGSGEKLHCEPCKMGLEGIISKLRNQPYRAGEITTDSR